VRQVKHIGLILALTSAPSFYRAPFQALRGFRRFFPFPKISFPREFDPVFCEQGFCFFSGQKGSVSFGFLIVVFPWKSLVQKFQMTLTPYRSKPLDRKDGIYALSFTVKYNVA
jgi:hypothetical protein